MASFSNTNDGLLIVGVDDETRKVQGAKTTKQRMVLRKNLETLDSVDVMCCTIREVLKR